MKSKISCWRLVSSLPMSIAWSAPVWGTKVIERVFGTVARREDGLNGLQRPAHRTESRLRCALGDPDGGGDHARGQAADQLRAAGGHDARDARRDGALRPRGDAAPGELRGPRARPGGVLVLRELLG